MEEEEGSSYPFHPLYEAWKYPENSVEISKGEKQVKHIFYPSYQSVSALRFLRIVLIISDIWSYARCLQ